MQLLEQRNTDDSDLPDFSRVTRTYELVKPHLARWLDAHQAQEIGLRLQEKASNMQPRIMVYGVYNAGKSTLLNALMGRAEAAMADVPKTFKVTPYPWLGYTLLDTPGIDAPAEHEQVSRSEMVRCDVVLFVLASTGISDEAETWREVIDILQGGRRLMLIINNKSGLELGSEDFFLVDENVRRNLSSASITAGVSDLLPHVSIQMVNASLALKGRLEAKPTLIEKSGILSLESNLSQFLRSTDCYTVFNTCRADLLQVIDRALLNLQIQEGNNQSQALEKFRQLAEQERSRLESVLRERLDQLMMMVQRQIARAIHDIVSSPDRSAASSDIEQTTELIASSVGDDLNSTFKNEADKTRQNLRNMGSLLEAELETAKVSIAAPLGMESSAGEEVMPLEMISVALRKIPIDQLAEQGTLAALEFGKQHLPTFFKQVGKKTMERWAHSVGKWAGPVVNAALFLWSIHRATQQDAEQRRELVRQTQAMDDIVGDFVGSLRHEYSRLISNVVAKVFAPMEDWLLDKENEVSSLQREVLESRDVLERARMELRG